LELPGSPADKPPQEREDSYDGKLCQRRPGQQVSGVKPGRLEQQSQVKSMNGAEHAQNGPAMGGCRKEENLDSEIGYAQRRSRFNESRRGIQTRPRHHQSYDRLRKDPANRQHTQFAPRSGRQHQCSQEQNLCRAGSPTNCPSGNLGKGLEGRTGRLKLQDSVLKSNVENRLVIRSAI
jgi:hypothetical protein